MTIGEFFRRARARKGEYEVNQYPNQSRPETRQIETVVHHIFPSISLVVEPVAEGVSTFVYRILL